jgi:DNA-binding transcriptional LysR family regulator
VRALKEIRAGELLQVLPNELPALMAMNLLFPHRRNIPKRVRVFADWMTEVVSAATA